MLKGVLPSVMLNSSPFGEPELSQPFENEASFIAALRPFWLKRKSMLKPVVREQLVISERSEGKASLLPVSVHDITRVSALGLTPEKRGQQQPSKVLAVYQRTAFHAVSRMSGVVLDTESALRRHHNGVEERDGLSIPCQKRPIRRPRVMCSC